MKVFVLSFVLLSICYGLNARCISGRDSSDDCPLRVFSEPEPRPIHYIYHGESCDCPKYHDIIVQKPQEEEKIVEKFDYEYNVDVPKKNAEQGVARYMFDVLVEKPVTPSKEPSIAYNYQLQEAPKPDAKTNSIRYILDTRVEEPIKPCNEKPWQGLVTQIDAVLSPHPKTSSCNNPDHTQGNCNCGCRNPNHSQGTCNCGCQNKSHTPTTCNCGKDLFNIPMFYSPVETSLKRIKRDTKSKNKKLSLQLKQHDIKLPKLKPLKKIESKTLKKIEPKELSAIFKAESLKEKTTTAKPFKISPKNQSLRLKRKEKSPCGFEYESCDPKRKTPSGCPLCYRCQCEPSENTDNQRFSPKDVRIPYRIVSHDQQFSPATQQEFDLEPSSYTGLKRPDMYKQYIEQVISKYPEHMSRKMPDVMEQQRDLMDFINDLAKHDKSPITPKEANSDVRYQIIDDALELYKVYENAIGKKPAPFANMNRKIFNKRGTVLEVIEIDADDLESGRYKLPIMDDDSSIDNSSY